MCRVIAERLAALGGGIAVSDPGWERTEWSRQRVGGEEQRMEQH